MLTTNANNSNQPRRIRQQSSTIISREATWRDVDIDPSLQKRCRPQIRKSRMPKKRNSAEDKSTTPKGRKNRTLQRKEGKKKKGRGEKKPSPFMRAPCSQRRPDAVTMFRVPGAFNVFIA